MKKNLESEAGKKKFPVKKRPGQPKPPLVYVLVLCKMLVLPLLCCLSLFASAAVSRDTAVIKEHVVKGIVTDEKKEPMPGVTVILEGTTVGVTTNGKGEFELRLPKGEGTLVFSFVGYKTVKKQIPLDNKIVQVCMIEDVSTLDEVTVVAYGEQSRRNVVGAMSTVTSEDLKDIPSPSLANLLQGRVAGMNITNMTGSPGGGGISVSIRGFNSLSIESTRRFSDPLWVIDGVPMLSFTSPVTGTNTLSEIDPSDIESVQVLKDAASAAIYGSRAANGVILVTTKKGKLNQRARVSVNVSRTFVFNPALPDLTGGHAERLHRVEALKNFAQSYYNRETNTYQFVGSYREAYERNLHYNLFWNMGDGLDIPALQDSLNPFYNNSTNLFDYYFQTAKVTDANVQLNGGSTGIAYNVGIGYYDESGVLKHSGFSRIKLLGNFLVQPFKGMESNFRVYLARTGRKRANRMMTYGDFTGGDELEQIPEELLATSTLMPGKGNLSFDETIKRFDGIKEKNESYRLRASFDLGYEIIEGLKIKSSVSVDYSQQNQNLFIPSNLDDHGESYSSGQITRNLMLLNENLLTYKRVFVEKHSVDFLAGLSFQVDEAQSLSAWGRGSSSDLIHYISWTGNVYDTKDNRVLKDALSDKSRSTMVGVFGRVNYNYSQKYYFSVTLRRDASSKFGEKVRWGTFPSYALAWTFSEEGFMDFTRGFLDYGKLRVSYGKSGRQFDQPYIALGQLSVDDPLLGKPTVIPNYRLGLMNRNLTWEETDQYDFGLDLDMLDHRLSVTLDYYYRYTDKLIYPVRLPGNYSGYIQQWRNAYAISNEGLELEVKYDLARGDKFNWDISFNIARNWNRLEKSENDRDLYTENSINNVSVIGKPLNGIYVLKTRGIYQDASEVPAIYKDGKYTQLGSGVQYYRPGDREIVDMDGDGKINSGGLDDRVYAGSPLPLASGGITTSLSWKGFDLNMLFNYVISRHILNAGRGASVGTSLGLFASDVVKPVFEDLSAVTFWKKPGDKTDYPANRLENGLSNFATNISANVENVSFIKLKTVTLGYTLPGTVRKKIGFGVRVFVSAENLFTVTNYSGADPESVDVVTGIDYLGNYPLSKRVTLGLTLNL